MNGKLRDVIVQDSKYYDRQTGMEVVDDLCLDVWADANKKSVIEKVKGIAWVFKKPENETHYMVYLDPRYDHEYLKREIEAAILCSE